MIRELLEGLRISLAGRPSGNGGGDWRSRIPDLRGGVKLAEFARDSADELREVLDRARRGELLRITLGEDRWQLVERMQATMSLIEGHAEHTMDAVGGEVLPSLPRLRAAMTRRRESRGLPWRVLERLLGLELKMRQYEVGRRFCDDVVRRAGTETLALAWRSPAELPTAAELADPAQWLKRVAVPA
jgi:putative hydrolase